MEIWQPCILLQMILQLEKRTHYTADTYRTFKSKRNTTGHKTLQTYRAFSQTITFPQFSSLKHAHRLCTLECFIHPRVVVCMFGSRAENSHRNCSCMHSVEAEHCSPPFQSDYILHANGYQFAMVATTMASEGRMKSSIPRFCTLALQTSTHTRTDTDTHTRQYDSFG